MKGSRLRMWSMTLMGAVVLLLLAMVLFVPTSAALEGPGDVDTTFDFESMGGWKFQSYDLDGSGSTVSTGADAHSGSYCLNLRSDAGDMVLMEKAFTVPREKVLSVSAGFYVHIDTGVLDSHILAKAVVDRIDINDPDNPPTSPEMYALAHEMDDDVMIGQPDADGWAHVIYHINLTSSGAKQVYLYIGTFDHTTVRVDDISVNIHKEIGHDTGTIWNSFNDFVETMGIFNISWQQSVMLLVACVLFVLAIRFKFEPLLLLPIGFGVFLANMPIIMGGEVTTLMGDAGFLHFIYFWGIKQYGLFPLIIFLGIGAMTDFGPLLANPRTALLGAAAQFGIFLTMFGALALGLLDLSIGPMHLSFDFGLPEAASIGIIGGADGPTAIYTSSQLAPHLLGPIAVAAYSYMALVPLIQPPIMRVLTTRKERAVKMEQLREVSKLEKVIFPIAVTLICALAVPSAVPLIGMLMFGNLIRESGVVNRLSETAQGSLINIITIFLGLCVGATMSGELFLKFSTIGILVLGIIAFSFGTASGVIMGKLFYILTNGKVNPLIGAAGVSAVPMAARVVNKVGQEEDPTNFLLMHAMGPNVAGVIGSAVAAGVLIALIG